MPEVDSTSSFVSKLVGIYKASQSAPSPTFCLQCVHSLRIHPQTPFVRISTGSTVPSSHPLEFDFFLVPDAGSGLHKNLMRAALYRFSRIFHSFKDTCHG